jgi:hypothetical protein
MKWWEGSFAAAAPLFCFPVWPIWPLNFIIYLQLKHIYWINPEKEDILEVNRSCRIRHMTQMQATPSTIMDEACSIDTSSGIVVFMTEGGVDAIINSLHGYWGRHCIDAPVMWSPLYTHVLCLLHHHGCGALALS